MIDATYLKAHRTASRLRKKMEPDDQRWRLISRTKGALNTKLHAVTDAKGLPLKFFMTAGQLSDYTGAAALLHSLPAAEWVIALTTPNGSEMCSNKRRYLDTMPVESNAAKLSVTTKDFTGAATVSKSCMVGSNAGAEPQRATIDALRPSCPPSPSRPPSCFGFENQ